MRGRGKHYIHSNNNVRNKNKGQFWIDSNMYQRDEGLSQILWTIRVCQGVQLQQPLHMEKTWAMGVDGADSRWLWSFAVSHRCHSWLGGFHSPEISLLTA